MKNSKYGPAQLPINQFNKTYQGLHKFILDPRKFDAYLFIVDKVICMVSVEYCWQYLTNKEDIDVIITQTKGKGLQLKVEDESAKFIGVDIEHQDNITT